MGAALHEVRAVDRREPTLMASDDLPCGMTREAASAWMNEHYYSGLAWDDAEWWDEMMFWLTQSCDER